MQCEKQNKYKGRERGLDRASIKYMWGLVLSVRVRPTALYPVQKRVHVSRQFPEQF